MSVKAVKYTRLHYAKKDCSKIQLKWNETSFSTVATSGAGGVKVTAARWETHAEVVLKTEINKVVTGPYYHTSRSREDPLSSTERCIERCLRWANPWRLSLNFNKRVNIQLTPHRQLQHSFGAIFNTVSTCTKCQTKKKKGSIYTKHGT